ncbi:hypothetical protein POTOM_048770 [Populus tomentosa]|uniref:Protein kinase domain-containing protein n=1 Tax=Populus tomentosa TaxID=118781 RepID=A0A8X8CAX9_POPTO|nr:hypothetical protein POTOM_048770 [Populus tomentosa]
MVASILVTSENRVLNIRHPDMGLKGRLPLGLEPILELFMGPQLERGYYCSNSTLHDHKRIADESRKPMEWPQRLHHNCNPRIIHQNIGSKRVLMDADIEPKTSYFGLARLVNPIDTHLSTFVNGEFGNLGYVAPEYTRTLVATPPKGDVYSCGTVLLELVTGEKPTHVAKAPREIWLN